MLRCRCYIDGSKAMSSIINGISFVSADVCLLINICCYVLIWCKLRKRNNAVGPIPGVPPATAHQSTKTEKYRNSIKVMSIFILAFIIQWQPYCIMTTVGMIGYHPPMLVFLNVIFGNLGGMINFFAYTYVRKRCQANNTIRQ